MKKFLKIAGLVLLALILLLLAIVFILPKTGPGQALIDRFTRPIIEDVVQSQLGSQITYDTPRGALPGELILTDVVLSNDDGPWASLGQARLKWHPLSAIRGRINVDDITITDASLLRPVPEFPEQPPKEEKPPSDGLSLPNLRVGNLTIDNFVVAEPVFGERYALDLDGDATMQGRRIDVNLKLDAMSGSDLADVKVLLNGKSLTLDLQLMSQPTGLISRLAQADGAIWMTLEGDGKLARWEGMLEGEFGAYGAVGGEVSGNLETLERAVLNLRVLPGSKLPESVLGITGDAVDLRATANRNGDELSVDIGNLAGRFGYLNGDVVVDTTSWKAGSVDIAGSLTDEFLADYGAELAAGDVALTGTFAPEGETGTAFDMRLQTPIATAIVQNGYAGGAPLLRGDVDLVARTIPFEAGPLTDTLQEGGSATTSLVVSDDMLITFRKLDARLGSNDTLVVTGDGQYAVETGAVDVSGTLKGAPALLNQLTTAAQFSGTVSARFAVKGTTDDLSANVTADLPNGQMGEESFAGGRLEAQMTGLPMRPAGSLSLAATDNSYKGNVRLQAEQSAIVVPALSFTTKGLTLSGNGRYDTSTGSATAKATLNADDGTQLITGQTVGGSALIDATIDGTARTVQATVTADGLSFNDNTIKTARITANGGFDRITYDIVVDEADVPGVYLAAVRSDGYVSISDDSKVVHLNQMQVAIDADTEETRISLVNPADIVIGDTIRAEDIRLDWLGDGTVAADIRYGSDLWVADVTASKLAIPNFSVPASIELHVDSREATPATFRIYAKATTEDEESFDLVADGQWTGETVNLRANLNPEGKGALATADVTYPLVLTRKGGTLGVEMPEDGFAAKVNVDGPLEVFFAFVPDLTIYASGDLSADIDVKGKPTAPLANGTIRLRNGRVEDDSVGVTLSAITGDVDMQYGNGSGEATWTITSAGAGTKPDAIRLSGGATMTPEATNVDAKLDLNNAELITSPELTLVTQANLALKGTLEELLLAGRINIVKLDAQIPSVEGNGTKSYTPVNVRRVDGPQPEVPELDVEEKSAPAIALDLQIRGNNQIFIRGRGLTSEWATNLDIGGTTAAPEITGTVTSREGTFKFAGREFDITEGRIAFTRDSALIPRLDLRAEYETTDVTAILSVSGTADDPKIGLSSNPPLPDEDVMSLILFGKEPTQLSAVESLQIASAVAQLSGVGGGGSGGFSNTLRSSIGLDALSLGVDPDTGRAAVEVGKYISDDIYVAARQSAGQAGTEITVTYEVNDKVTVESTLKPNGAQNVSANYKKDY
ncbi:translocation/assembly module TamB domain-containing protein [Parvularcula sp. LCG005]|uniref:translocation/assembly module TamB domain-containing protein n=1 Tax=Parvularcula sp. LCG005 TaxID=3078805 RepID=UPI0029437030|nr:translocation/assembly module TamB domain-containing protein [Parvularcula sp. LCG005]WOI52043.1 translocation/assembly module TamB domain-containing protein [Parvularcula sp. LCG005]